MSCVNDFSISSEQNAAAGNLFNNNNGLRQSGSARHNEYMYEQHKAAGFSPLESHAQIQFAHKSMQQQHQMQPDNNYWLNSVQQQVRVEVYSFHVFIYKIIVIKLIHSGRLRIFIIWNHIATSIVWLWISNCWRHRGRLTGSCWTHCSKWIGRW